MNHTDWTGLDWTCCCFFELDACPNTLSAGQGRQTPQSTPQLGTVRALAPTKGLQERERISSSSSLCRCANAPARRQQRRMRVSQKMMQGALFQLQRCCKLQCTALHCNATFLLLLMMDRMPTIWCVSIKRQWRPKGSKRQMKRPWRCVAWFFNKVEALLAAQDPSFLFRWWR